MDFEASFQNLFGISKCSLKQCCRELNFEQLLFWGQVLKMLFSTSKFEFRVVSKFGFEIIKEKAFSRVTGPAPRFRPTGAGQPSLTPVPTRTGVPTVLRRSMPHGGRTPSTPVEWLPVALTTTLAFTRALTH
jgi:hypothetical protein